VRLVKGNAHLWVSIRGAIKQTKRIASELAKIDRPNAQRYEQNAENYVAKLDALHDEIEKALKPLKSRQVITFHEAFPYFAEEFDLNVVGVVEREPGAEPNARELANTIKLIRASKAAALFAEPQYSAKSAEVIARETGIAVSFLDPVVTGPMKPEEARDHYLAAMRGNLAALLKALPH
jgi:zinc transport system substrate-binding protein